LNRAFQEIVENPEWQAFNLKIHSQPNPTDPDILDGPWVITLDDFVTKDECTKMIELGRIEGYERSEDLSDEMNVDGSFDGKLSEDRTSTNAWCTDDCFEDTATKGILERIERLLHIPESNYEYLQLLRYDVGQFYGVHHDYSASFAKRPPGPRVGPSCVVIDGARRPNALLTNPSLFRS
jgi:prolyl 4-hydroxylase